jgi:hypothetical protein
MIPYIQEMSEGKIIRSFSPDVDVEELKWHQDLKDRRVKILKCSDWYFQMEDELPKKMIEGEELFIPKMTWHRVIKGNDSLIVEIQEY